MRCTDCNYPLWNTPAGNCPECGKPFTPSTHTFQVGEVRFRCPDCGQDYFGDDLDGHLRPSSFNCVSCGRHLHEDECLLFPADGDMDAIADVRMPWFDTSRRWLGRWFSTIGWAISQPSKLIDGVPKNSGIGPGVVFLALNATFFCVVWLLPVVLIMGIQRLAATSEFLFFLLFPIGICVAVFIQGSVTHGILVLSGGTQYGYSRTMAAATFSTGPFVLCSVPCLGMCVAPLGLIWWLVLMCIMVHVGQGVNGLRATLSSLVVPATITILWLGALVLEEYWGYQQAGTRWTTGQAMVGSPVDASVEELIASYTDSGGSLVGVEDFKVMAPMLANSGNTRAAITEQGECWWLGNVFAFSVKGETNLVVLVYMPDGTLMHYRKTDSTMRKGGSSGMPLTQMVEDIQVVREEEGSPRIPQDLLDAWVDTQEP